MAVAANLKLVRDDRLGPVVPRGVGAIHECCVCGKRGVWGRGWSWWGSPLELQNGPVPKTCSAKCRRIYAARTGVSDEISGDKYDKTREI